MRGFGGPNGPDDLRDPSELVDDETVDALIAGHPVDGRFDDLAAFASDARTLADRPVPRPSAALLDVLAHLRGRVPTVDRTTPSPDRRHRYSAAASVAGLSVVGKIAAGALVGAASVAAAGAAGVLPEPVGREVRHLIEVTTTIEFPGHADDAHSPDRPATHRPPAEGQGAHPTSTPALGPRGSEQPADPVRPDGPRHGQPSGNGHATAPGQQSGNGRATAPAQQSGVGQATAPGQQSGNGHTTAPGQQSGVGQATAPGQQSGNGHTTAPGQRHRAAGPADDGPAEAGLDPDEPRDPIPPLAE